MTPGKEGAAVPHTEQDLHLRPLWQAGQKIVIQINKSSSYLISALDSLYIYLGLLAFAVIALAWTVASSTICAILPLKISEAIGPRMVMGAARLYIGMLGFTSKVRFDLRELDSLRCDGGSIIAPNHPSMLDAVMIISRLPRVVCVTKAKLWDNPLLGGGMRMAGYIRNDAPIKLTKLAVAKLQRGQQLLLFPEGTRTTQRPVNTFRGGFALMAKMAGAPVQTVFIETNSPFLGKGWPLLKKPELPLVYRVRLGKRFEVEGDVKQFTVSLERYFHDELRDAATRPPDLD
jgi:1-acyl-sn-glycerol-3-phosphate acyltransferase